MKSEREPTSKRSICNFSSNNILANKQYPQSESTNITCKVNELITTLLLSEGLSEGANITEVIAEKVAIGREEEIMDNRESVNCKQFVNQKTQVAVCLAVHMQQTRLLYPLAGVGRLNYLNCWLWNLVVSRAG